MEQGRSPPDSPPGAPAKQRRRRSPAGLKWNTALLALGALAISVAAFVGGQVSIGGDKGVRFDTKGLLSALASARKDRPAGKEVSQSELQQREPKRATLPLARVLWVDDKPLNNQFERDALAHIGIFVDAYTNNSDGLAALARVKYDVIVSDIGREGNQQSGWDLLARVRDGNPRVPFFFYTSSAPDSLRSKASAQGATGATASPDELVRSVVEVSTTDRER